MRNRFKNILLASAVAMSLGAAPAAFAGDQLEIRNFVGTINWSNGPMNVDVKKNAGDTDISGRSNITVDGGFDDIDNSACKSSYGNYSFDWFGKKKEGNFGGYEDLDDFPVLEITMPEDTDLIIENSVVFSDGTPNVASADLELRYCGQVTLGDVENTLALDSRGSADLRVGNTGQIAASLKGSGDLTGGDSGDVILNSRGSGDVELENIASLEADSRGSGDLDVSNVSGDVEISSYGSGDAELESVDGSLSYSGRGSGNLDVSSVSGEAISVESYGSGDVDISGGEVASLKMTARGSATLEFDGTAENAELRASGSGDIYADRVTGDADIRTSGSGDVDIDNRN